MKDQDESFTLATLETAWRRLLDEFTLTAAALDPAANLHYRSTSGGEYDLPVWQVIMHVVNHGTYHRGQIVTMLRQLGKPVPSLDLHVFYHDTSPAADYDTIVGVYTGSCGSLNPVSGICRQNGFFPDDAPDSTSLLRNADAVYIDQIRKAGLYDEIWQAFAVLLPVKTVGVMGDGRTYEYVVGLRAVTSTDGMTADFYPFDMAFIGRVATRIINEVKGVNRVVYDVTSKPPGTIEWE